MKVHVAIPRLLAVLLIAVVALAAAFNPAETARLLRQALQTVENLGPWGPILFMAINAAGVILFMPGLLMTLAAGYLFGILAGTLYIALSTTAGAAAAFMLGRHAVHDLVARRMQAGSRLGSVDRLVAEGRWKFILLLRLVPFFPFKLSNYFFGITSVRFADFVIGTGIGILPLTMISVYFGSLTGSLAQLAASGRPGGPQLALLGAGFVILIVVALVVIRMARRVLRRRMLMPPPPRPGSP